jgi:hypothetical protein
LLNRYGYSRERAGRKPALFHVLTLAIERKYWPRGAARDWHIRLDDLSRPRSQRPMNSVLSSRLDGIARIVDD